MAYFNNSANVKTGVNSRSHFNLSFHHVTTQEISRLQPIMIREMIPGDKFNVRTQSFHRLAPLPVPTYGNLQNVTRAFFVPARILMRGFEQVITQTTLQTAQGPVNPNIPYFTNAAYIGMFTVPSNNLATTSTQSSYDFKISSSSGTDKYFKFTVKGKLYYNLFISLGYGFNWTTLDTTPMSLLPLLAYLRVYLDWYMPTQYEPTDPLYPFLKETNISFTTPAQLYNFCSNCLNFFEKLEKDFYSSAWSSPAGPVGLRNFNIESKNIAVSNTGVQGRVSNGNGNSAYPSISVDSSIQTLTQYGLNTLAAVQDYVNRDMIAGNRYIEQMFARYGVKVPDAWLQRCEYLGSHSEPIQISDVMSTSGTAQSALGDYAGKGISLNNGSFNYESKEFGFFIVLNCIIAKTGYVQGRDKQVLHLDPLDFYTPEFDQLGASPIRNDELFTGFVDDFSYNAGQSYGGKPNGVFGFQAQYYEYKNSRDYLTGDFAIRSRNQNLNSYHLFRHIEDPEANTPLALNLAFMSGDPTTRNNNFNRIFQTIDDYNDHFMSEHFLDVSASRPMHSTADSLVTEGGHEIEMSFNGYQL